MKEYLYNQTHKMSYPVGVQTFTLRSFCQSLWFGLVRNLWKVGQRDRVFCISCFAWRKTNKQLILSPNCKKTMKVTDTLLLALFPIRTTNSCSLETKMFGAGCWLGLFSVSFKVMKLTWLYKICYKYLLTFRCSFYSTQLIPCWTSCASWIYVTYGQIYR